MKYPIDPGPEHLISVSSRRCDEHWDTRHTLREWWSFLETFSVNFSHHLIYFDCGGNHQWVEETSVVAVETDLSVMKNIDPQTMETLQLQA